MTCGQRRALRHRSKRLDEGLHHQNSLESVLEREGINSMACTVHEVYIYIHVNLVVLCTEIWAS